MTESEKMIMGRLTTIMGILSDCHNIVEKDTEHELELLRSYHKIAGVRNDLLTKQRNEYNG